MAVAFLVRNPSAASASPRAPEPGLETCRLAAPSAPGPPSSADPARARALEPRYFASENSANAAPCVSSQGAIRPPGTSMGPSWTLPPAARTRSIAASRSGTLK